MSLHPDTVAARRLVKIEEALRLVGTARELLKQAKCPQSLAYVRRAMKSVEGARRHALRMQSQTESAYSQILRPIVKPMLEENPMHSLGYRWEVHYPDGSHGGAVLRAEAERMGEMWEGRNHQKVAP